MVDDIPWLDHDPTTPGNPCCSSVLFLPGIEGSRLYATQNGSFDPGEAIRRLWEPISNGEVRSLYLDKNGYSSSSIYVGSPIDKALGVMDVYGKFMDFLNGLVKTGEIKEWRSFGYDWRLPASDIVLDPAMRATTTESLIAITEALASRSKTGKVTIIAHSYGGLVAKYLIKALEDIGESDIVDKVISVAVPYIGTPQALAGLLHGDDTAIAYGVILMRSVARGLAENMPSVYLLLPSSRYFTEVKAPVISFETKKVSLVNNGSYSQNIDSSAGQRGFIADIFDERSKAGIFDTSLPLIGNDLLLSEADAFHDDIDGYGWPSSIEDWALVGWNKPTTSGIYYYDTASCSVPMFGIPCPGHKDLKTDMGDGTVIAKSAAFGNDAGRIISLDLKAIDKAERGYFNHMNILESSTTQAAIRKIVIGSSTSGTGAGSSASGSGGSVSSGSSLASERNMLQGISNEDPISTEKTDSLSVIVSAPAEIHVYDKYGNHTGPIMPFVGIGAESGLYSVYETKIPGSAFTSERYDSGYGDTQIELPYEYNAYTIVIKAVGSGILSLAIVHSKDGGIVDQVAFPSIPITSLTSATTTVIISSASGAAALCSPVKRSLASSTSPLLIDFDGLGFTEASVYP